ncbi:speckle-type POZ protein-like [Gigantopelta aegis]|uniref:speckle-type POZ protein-like n=1 Tax=Gigantopelta aegis TaxID=1735272 RepID=UPI001B88BCC8|nr:speckle-type POZ protein-like [Gigantopelta aegis]
MATQNEVGSTEVTFEKPDPYTDIELLVEGKGLYCNKTMLSYASPVFAKMFHGEFTEKDQTKISLPEKKYDDFRSFLLCIHPGTLEDITDKNVDIIVPLVDEYQVIHLKKKCDCFLEKTITQLVENKKDGFRGKLVHYLQLANKYNLIRTYKKAVESIASQPFKYMKPELNKAKISDQLKLEILTLRVEGLESKKLSVYC